jgi:hypothetical protein
MMAANFDKVIFLISTDFFATELFDEFDLPDIEKLKQTARHAVPEIIRGGGNYFMDADSSPIRQQKTQHDFFAQLQAQKVDMGLQKKIHFFYEILCNPNPGRNAAANVITSVAACLYWLYEDKFKTPITDELIDLIALIEPLGLYKESPGDELSDLWLNSPSKWDQYVMSLMDGIDEVPYLTFDEITKFSSQFDFLIAWKKLLGEEKFSVIRDFIIIESHFQLDDSNPESAKQIDKIMSAI